jgi:transposase
LKQSCSICYEYGMRKPRVSLDHQQIQRMVQDYLGGTHSTVLANRYGVTQPTIAYWLRKRNVRIRSRSETNRMRAPVNIERLIRLVDAADLSQRGIAALLGVSLPTIERTLRRIGLKSKRGRGSPLEKNYFWAGGERREKEGYILLKSPNHPHATASGYVREHRLVMEKVVGRYLRPSEVVHHRDGNPRNNAPDNLELFSSNAAHLHHEWKTSWAEKRLALQRKQSVRQQTNRRQSSPTQQETGTDVVR